MTTPPEKIVERILTVSAGISALTAVLIFAFLLVFGLPLLGGGHVLGLLTDPWAPRRGLYGVMPMLLGTVSISSMSMVFALPLSFGCAALVSVFAPRRFGAFLRRAVQMMTGVPTVIYGFVGIFLLVPLVREMFQSGSGMCILSASLMLAVVISPTLVLFFVDGFDRAPKSSMDAVAALGGNRVQQFLFVILPTARKSVLSGIVLAFGRALGDTLIALMIAGNAAQVPGSLLESVRTLTAHIALVIAADYDSPEFTSIFACGLILYLFSTILVVCIQAIGTLSGGENSMSRWMEKMIVGFAWLCGLGLLAAIAGIFTYLLYRGAGAINLKLIFGDTDPLAALLLQQPVFAGIFSAIVGTCAVVALSVSFAVPVGMASGIYMAEYARGVLKKVLGLFFDILAGVPSIVIGLFGFALAIFLHRHFSANITPSLIISALSLAMLVLPYIIRSTQVALENLPAETKLIAVALGATKLQNIIYVLIPRALPGIISGVILAVGRCAEDTAVIMLTGVVASAGIPKSIFAHYEALPFYIYYISSQYADTQELMSGYGASLILLLICALLFFFAILIQKGVTYQAFYRA